MSGTKRVGPEVSDMPDLLIPPASPSHPSSSAGRGGSTTPSSPRAPGAVGRGGTPAPSFTTAATTSTTTTPMASPRPSTVAPDSCPIGSNDTYTISSAGKTRASADAERLVGALGNASGKQDPGAEVVHQMLEAMNSDILSFVICVMGNLGETDNGRIAMYWTSGNILNFAAAAIERRVAGPDTSGHGHGAESVNVFVDGGSRPGSTTHTVPAEVTAASGRIAGKLHEGFEASGGGRPGDGSAPPVQHIGVLQSEESCAMGVWDRSSTAALPKPTSKGELILQQLMARRSLSSADVEAWKAMYGKNDSVFGKGSSVLSGMSPALSNADQWITIPKALMMTFMQPLMLAAVTNATARVCMECGMDVPAIHLMTHQGVMSYFAMFVASYIGKAKIRGGNLDRRTQQAEWNAIHTAHAILFRNLMYGADGELRFSAFPGGEHSRYVRPRMAYPDVSLTRHAHGRGVHKSLFTELNRMYKK